MIVSIPQVDDKERRAAGLLFKSIMTPKDEESLNDYTQRIKTSYLQTVSPEITALLNNDTTRADIGRSVFELNKSAYGYEGSILDIIIAVAQQHGTTIVKEELPSVLRSLPAPR